MKTTKGMSRGWLIQDYKTKNNIGFEDNSISVFQRCKWWRKSEQD